MDIPEDVVTQILVRLPVKSLLRFRCVCKAWCVLIGSRRFADLHLRHPSQGRGNEYLLLESCESVDGENTVLSFYCRDGGDVLKAAAPDWRPAAMSTVSMGGPINGICLVATSERPGLDPYQSSLYLCNPATREFRKIPDSPFGRQRARPSRFSCYGPPFDCRRVSVGFGYDPRTNVYKVVSMMLFLEDEFITLAPAGGPLKIEIYDLSSNSWRVADTIFPTIIPHKDPGMEHYPDYPSDLGFDYHQQGMFEDFTCGLFFNGSIHWKASGFNKVIIAFNISDEVIQAFRLPRGISVDESSHHPSLYLLEDSLAFVQTVINDESYPSDYYAARTCFYVWVMVEYGDEESWTRRFYFQPEIYMNVLAFWDDMLICETKEGELASCNLREDAPQFRKHQQCIHQFRMRKMGAIVMHKQSLVRLR